MRVGISILTHAGQSVWENGLNQNIFFLGQLLQTLPMVREVVLLNCGDQASVPPEAEAAALGWPLLFPRDATDRVDVVIEMGGGLDVAWLDYVRARGKKVIFMCCGQPYAALAEPSVFKRSGYFSRPQRCDVVWMLSKDRAFKSMLEALHRCPAFEVPFLWDPVFVKRRASEVTAAGFQFGYQPNTDGIRPRALRPAIFEPNVSVLKSCMIPLLIADQAYRDEPQTVANLHVLNSVHMKAHPTFVHMVASLALYRESRLHLDHHHDVTGYVSQFSDAVISHQWQNDQNILYLDVLYGGYPLIHNSPWLGEVGYYYRESHVEAGAQRLREAAHHHDENYANYVRDAQALIRRLAPQTESNGTAYAQRLLQVCGSAVKQGAPC
ncbi:hypothetical protein WT27_28880 [Burkholderia territorii]|uniref:DUF2827 domain-containing protein n=1 Tax=Burkholderia territorii TaxID=1503055 RepID=A0A105VRK8_9BURK|nr:DUF2827 family protein [Burkholderia territorii]KVV52637.1 hypothetical protein WT27_28880 [Burkholderia territorii]KVX41330.1 hypothetical protein WT31_29715 [Burkholderia territorii]